MYSSNILVHRNIFLSIEFDEGFEGWGWEDVDWGLRVVDEFPVFHIENTATHLGLDYDHILLEKYRKSGRNFSRVITRHPGALKSSALYRAASIISRLKIGRLSLTIASGTVRARWIPIKLRLYGLKAFRAASCADNLQ